MSRYQPWRARYEELLDEEGFDFEVLKAAPRSDRPLLIWIHPGDAIEDREAFDRREDYENTRQFQARMAEEIEDLVLTHQVVVLHRESSGYAFDQEHAYPEYADALAMVEELSTTVLLYGDDLDQVSAWLIAELGANQRPQVFMTGAWSDPQHGCVAIVGQALDRAGAPVLRVSSWSPSEPGSIADVWQPEPKSVPPTPAAVPPSPRSPRRQPR
jgi:hypothetical protein